MGAKISKHSKHHLHQHHRDGESLQISVEALPGDEGGADEGKRDQVSTER